MESGLTSRMGTGLPQKRWSQVLPRYFSQLLKAYWVGGYCLQGLMRGFTILFVWLCFQQKFMESLYNPGPALGARATVVNKKQASNRGEA